MKPKNKVPSPRVRDLPRIGGQLSSAGGWSQVPGRALAAEVEVVQIFSSNPRIWPVTPPDARSLAGLGDELRRNDLPLFIHAVYLINPASPDSHLRVRSAAALAHALLCGALAGAEGVVTHLGSHRGDGFDKAAPLIAETIRVTWSAAQRDLTSEYAHSEAAGELPPLLLETAAGSGATVGGTLMELRTLLDLLARPLSGEPSPRAGLCLDTAHMFAAGYALHEAAGLAALVDELERLDLMRHVGLIHLNDSASLFDSKRDRHANPGEGELGHMGLARLVTHPAFAHVPFVLEVPGSDGHGPGQAEIATVKRMRKSATPTGRRPGARERGPGAS